MSVETEPTSTLCNHSEEGFHGQIEDGQADLGSLASPGLDWNVLGFALQCSGGAAIIELLG